MCGVTLAEEDICKYSPLRYVSHDIINYDESYLSAVMAVSHCLYLVLNDRAEVARQVHQAWDDLCDYVNACDS